MTPNAWAHAWETTLRAAITDEALWLAGHNDLTAGGLTHLTLDAGSARATVTSRHSTTPAHPAITTPVLTHDQIALLQSASPDCGHHQALRTGVLPECLLNLDHTASVRVRPAAEEITFSCDCGISPCQHHAALAHAVTARLTTRPADFAALRGLPAQVPHESHTRPDPPVTTTRTTPGGKFHIPAHSAWAWYRECSEPPLLPAYAPEPASGPVADFPEGAAPPPPAPEPEQLHALISDAAAQARAYLLDASMLQCARHEDALRLAAAVPGGRLPEVAERLAMDIADLREQLSTYTPAVGQN